MPQIRMDTGENDEKHHADTGGSDQAMREILEARDWLLGLLQSETMVH